MHTRLFRHALSIVALGAVPLGAAAQHVDERGLERHLYPPEIVMRHQSALKLQPAQRADITQAIKDFQARMVEFQWKLQEESQKLAALLEQPTVDQGAALAQVDAVLALERDIKRAHLGLLIHIKNRLTAEQQEQLRKLHRHLPGQNPGDAHEPWLEPGVPR